MSAHPIIERLENALAPWMPPPLEYKRRRAKLGTTPRISQSRMRRYAEAALGFERRDLAAMAPRTGRNHRLFLAGCRLGKFVHHGVLRHDELESALVADACGSNGLIREDGLRKCTASLNSGLRKAEGDDLPDLDENAAEQTDHKQKRADGPGEDDVPAADQPKGEKRGSTEKLSQATMLAAIAMGDDVDLFRTPEGDAYADIRIDGHRETWAVRSKGFRFWLRGAYFKQTATAVGNDATTSALDIVEAQAQFGGALREVHLRVAERDGRIYINLANSKWQAVEIAPSGWRVVDEPPVRFVRKYGMVELPEPVRGGSIAKIREHLRVQDEGFSLIIAWLLAALRPRGPYPVLALTGEQGTAKSTTLRMLRSLVDPNTAPLRAPPDCVKDLYVAAVNGHVITFDNVSYLSSDVSDAMCRLATGGGFSTRALYTDNEEKLFDGQRPQGLNGIGAVVSRPDLLERTLGVQLETIPDDARKLEEDLWAAFAAATPGILGALYDAVAHGLELLPDVRPNRLPRMADFARWSVACETAYQKPGTFMMAYGGYIDEAAHIALESDILAQALMDYMRQQRRGEHGHRHLVTTSGDLLNVLTASVGEQHSRNKLWPKSPEGMAAKLARLAPVLRKIGITMERAKREPGTGRRPIVITDKRANT